MIDIILTALYLMLPAYFANMVPLLVRKVNFLNVPVDFNKKWKGKPIFGSHKTWRGMFFGVIAGVIVAYIQFVLLRYSFFADISLLDYSNWLVVGFLLGFGALVGDAIKSFFKRRVGVKPGGKFIPWDEIDYTIGALLFISLVYIPSWQIILAVLILNFILHIAVNHIGYYLGINDVKW